MGLRRLNVRFDNPRRQLVYKWRDSALRRGTHVHVAPGQVAVFVDRGAACAVLAPGWHRVDGRAIPALSAVGQTVFGSTKYLAELYFISTLPVTGLEFDARLETVADAGSGLVVTLEVRGTHSVRVTDSVRLLTGMVGPRTLADPAAPAAWVRDHLLQVVRSAIGSHLADGSWPVLGVSSRLQAAEPAIVASVNSRIAAHGIVIDALADCEVAISNADLRALKQLADQRAHIAMAGSYREYAVGQALLGAGAGMAKGGAGAANVLLAAGLGQSLAAVAATDEPAAG